MSSESTFIAVWIIMKYIGYRWAFKIKVFNIELRKALLKQISNVSECKITNLF